MGTVPEPGNAEDYSSYFFTGREALAAKDLADAERCLDQASRRTPAPDLPPPEEGPGRTEACYAQALALDPDCLEARLNLGALLAGQKRWGEAETQFRRARERFPEHSAPWRGLGALYQTLRRDVEAERCLRRALELDPGSLPARFTLAQLLLRQGRFGEGWQALEARALNVAYSFLIPAPRWQGERLEGKALLIAQEGGHGDMLQFCRYVPILKAMGAARLGIICQPALKRLFASLPGIDAVVARGEEVPEAWDFWTLPLSLPLHCATRIATIPAPLPYLAPPPEEVQAWLPRLPAARRRVGLAWKGNPLQAQDSERSLPHLQTLAPLARPGIRFVSLQKGPGEEEAQAPPPALDLLDAAPWIRDFADTAALMTHLDLVIAVDSAVAHLAGALARPCWVLLPHAHTHWRWQEDREDSPWYPGALRLFRQGAGEDWSAVVERVAQALEGWVEEPV